MSFNPYTVFFLFCLTAFMPWQTSWATMDSSELSQCEQLAKWTSAEVNKNTQKGATQELYASAQNCFRNNACSLMTDVIDVNKPICARTIALNSYLIGVSYRTKKPAQPLLPSISTLPAETFIAKSQNQTTAIDNKAETINWS